MAETKKNKTNRNLLPLRLIKQPIPLLIQLLFIQLNLRPILMHGLLGFELFGWLDDVLFILALGDGE